MFKIDKEEWKEWQEHRITKLLLNQYLPDKIAEVVTKHSEIFRSGNFEPDSSETLTRVRDSAFCVAYQEVIDIELEQIFDFYKEEDHADKTVTE